MHWPLMPCSQELCGFFVCSHNLTLIVATVQNVECLSENKAVRSEAVTWFENIQLHLHRA